MDDNDAVTDANARGKSNPYVSPAEMLVTGKLIICGLL